MAMGHHFVWATREPPYIIRSDGMHVQFEVHGRIPYLASGATRRRPHCPSGRPKRFA